MRYWLWTYLIKAHFSMKISLQNQTKILWYLHWKNIVQRQNTILPKKAKQKAIKRQQQGDFICQVVWQTSYHLFEAYWGNHLVNYFSDISLFNQYKFIALNFFSKKIWKTPCKILIIAVVIYLLFLIKVRKN